MGLNLLLIFESMYKVYNLVCWCVGWVEGGSRDPLDRPILKIPVVVVVKYGENPYC